MKNTMTLLLFSIFLSMPAQAIKISPCSTEECSSNFSSFKKAAQRGHPQAMYMLGKFYQNGYGTEINLEKSLKYYKKAALKGIFEAKFKTGYLLLMNPDTYNYNKGIKWLTNAANSGHPNAAFLLGLTYYDERKFTKADKWLTLAYQKNQVDMPNWISRKNKDTHFTDTNLPLLTSEINTDSTNGYVKNIANKNNVERITISAPSLQNVFDNMLIDFKSKIKSTGTRLPSIRCVDNVACQQKSLNEMKDSIWVSR